MSLNRRLVPVAAALLAAAFAVGQDVKIKNGWHEDSKFGLKFRIPDKWEQVPVSVDERFIVAKYLCNRDYMAKGEFSVPHKPSLRVMVFLDEMKKRVGPKVEVAEEEGVSRVNITGPKATYKNYAEYLKETLGEGHHVEKDEEGKGAGGLVCRKMDVRLERGALVKRRITTWVFRGEDGDYAMEFDCLEDHADKLVETFKASLATFQFIKRAAVLTAGGTTDDEKVGGSGGSDRKRWKEYSAEERKNKRKREEVTRFQKTKKSMPADWVVKESKNFYVLTHADERFTQTVVDASEACRKWLDEQFGDATDEYVMKGVIRIFKDYDEYRAFVRDVSDWSPSRREIDTYKDASMGRRSGMDQLFRYLGRSYLADKDSALAFGLPTWFDDGFSGLLGAAVHKGGQFVVEADVYENQAAAEAIRGKKVPKAKALLEMSNQDFYKEWQANSVAATRLVRWLLGAGKKDKLLKSTVKDFLAAAIANENESGGVSLKDIGAEKEATTEEEEEEQMKKRKEAAKSRSGETTKAINDRALKEWTDKHWEALQKALDGAIK